jgi:hypothetical protein
MGINEKIWHSKRTGDDNAEIEEFGKPVAIQPRPNYLTCVSLVGRGGIQVLAYGERAKDYWNIIANARYFDGKIQEGDVMWVDGEKPIEAIENEYGYGASANAKVKSVSKVNFTINILLERNQNQVTK